MNILEIHNLTKRFYTQCYGLLLTGGSDFHGIYENDSPAVGTYLCPEQTIDEMGEMGLC